jgi:predicted RNase H-like HicB family nuclease
MTRHAAMIYWSDEDDVFIAYAPDLPRCVAHGDTRAEALASLEEAMDAWIEVAREFGNPVPEPRPRDIEFDVDRSVT